MKILPIAVIFLTISGCTLFRQPEPTVITKEVIVYPSLPTFQAPTPIPVQSPTLDYPRGDSLVVKNSRKCKEIPEENRDDEFWEDCGVLEVDLDSNLYAGFDENNFDRLNQLLSAAKIREQQWRSLLETINEQIRLWSSKE